MARTVSERADAVLALADIFRVHGFEGASLSVISAKTGLGKGSLYNFFPGGKEEMASSVLDEVSDWFRREVYEPLRAAGEPHAQVAAMFETSAGYFESRQLVCLFGAFALGQERERFARAIGDYFTEWVCALASALTRCGTPEATARAVATDTVCGIQGALILSRAVQEPDLFRESLARLEARVFSTS